jgi:hypothetical protein
VLDQTTSSWVQLAFGDERVVYFTQLVTCGAAISEIRYGLDRAEPHFLPPANTTTFPTPSMRRQRPMWMLRRPFNP